MEEFIYNLQLSENKIVPIHIERKSIRNYYIKISPDLNIVVPIPLKIDIETIYKFLNSRIIKFWFCHFSTFKNFKQKSVTMSR